MNLFQLSKSQNGEKYENAWEYDSQKVNNNTTKDPMDR
jgi:hypothetical protein